MSDHSVVESTADHVEPTDPVRIRSATGRGRRRPSRPVVGQQESSSDGSYARQDATEAVSSLVSEIKTQLSTFFNELRLNLSSSVGDSAVMSTNERHFTSEQACHKALDSHITGTDKASPEAEFKGPFIFAKKSSKTSLQGNDSRVDDWIDSIPHEGVPQMVQASTNNYFPYNALQQLGPSVKIESFDGDPRQWETFIGSFKALVHDVVQSNAQRIAILSQLLSPRLRTSLGTCLHSPDMYPEALASLRRLFGDPSRALDIAYSCPVKYRIDEE
uniref:Uncharacterized protein n=1 Tax=Trichuris muris TaxID=70415 RepID=A0A5S6QLU9_TRIMR